MNIVNNMDLNREGSINDMKNILNYIELNKSKTTCGMGIYVYGDPGIGKTTFVMNTLKQLDYDIIRFEINDTSHKTILNTIGKNNMSDTNVISMFGNKRKRIVIVMDEIDSVCSGDKGSISSFIKLVRPKKTKKQLNEEKSINPIVYIGNNNMEKKNKELLKNCQSIYLQPFSNETMQHLITSNIGNINSNDYPDIVKYIGSDLRKLVNIIKLYSNDFSHSIKNLSKSIVTQSPADNNKQVTQYIMSNDVKFKEHSSVMNDTDRTIIGLLWHENIADILDQFDDKDKPIAILFYKFALNNICLSDNIDRITFQKQIWQFNEMSSLIKTFYNNEIYHEAFTKRPKYNPSEVRFTKVLTKYSTEYNNYLFTQHLSFTLGMDQKDMFAFF